MTREYGYVVTFWTNVPPHGRVWINKDVDWSIDSEEEGMSNRPAVVAEMSNSSVAIYVGSIWKRNGYGSMGISPPIHSSKRLALGPLNLGMLDDKLSIFMFAERRNPFASF